MYYRCGPTGHVQHSVIKQMVEWRLSKLFSQPIVFLPYYGEESGLSSLTIYPPNLHPICSCPSYSHLNILLHIEWEVVDWCVVVEIRKSEKQASWVRWNAQLIHRYLHWWDLSFLHACHTPRLTATLHSLLYPWWGIYGTQWWYLSQQQLMTYTPKILYKCTTIIGDVYTQNPV